MAQQPVTQFMHNVVGLASRCVSVVEHDRSACPSEYRDSRKHRLALILVEAHRVRLCHYETG